ncbi:unnamed protein product [Medioppia subpectinata]|uniref:Ig-like domain-containing protein n=1 Tax=Medioppia subpectinata TaxID=1979941 RepID=A0A7R9PXB3_9ACAR|nr:unnamed protein product [Medioppia subpectinata]CAG2104642.1 unnamed protein product [Medioppia subpectinata]
MIGLERVDDKAFVKLKNVVELDLSLNNLKYIPTHSFTPMAKLRTLDLSSNLIPSVPKHSFYNLSDLKTLSLERNRITFIDDNAFEGLLRLESLKLSQNELTYMESKVLMPLSLIHSLTLSENNWKCDCSLRSLRKYLLANTRVSVIDEPKCTESYKVWTQLGEHSGNEKAVEGSTLRLDCSTVLTEDEDSLPLTIQWYWRNIHITNNSRGCDYDCRTVKNQKLKTSRLELSSVLSFNSGRYVCVVKNNAGRVEKFFDVSVSAPNSQSKVTAAAASSESHFVNDSQTNSYEESGTDKVVIVLFGISVVLLCRRRRQKHSNHTNNCQTDGTELEKLTPNTEPSLRVNPIQKPPRLAMNNYSLDKEIPQVWLIKHNINGNSNVSHHQNYAESDYSTQLLYNENYSDTYDTIIEPDLVHPSAYVRERHIQVTDLDAVSAQSDGTEV